MLACSIICGGSARIVDHPLEQGLDGADHVRNGRLLCQHVFPCRLEHLAGHGGPLGVEAQWLQRRGGTSALHEHLHAAVWPLREVRLRPPVQVRQRRRHAPLGVGQRRFSFRNLRNSQAASRVLVSLPTPATVGARVGDLAPRHRGKRQSIPPVCWHL